MESTVAESSWGGGAASLERELDAVCRVAGIMARGATDMRGLLTMLMDESKRIVQAEASALMLYDETAEELFFEVALGEKGDALKEVRLKLGEGVAGACARSRDMVIVQDCHADDRHAKHVDAESEFETRNLIAAPLLRGGRLLGVLEVLNKEGGRDFSDEDARLIRFFADQAALAIENAHLVAAAVQAERLAGVGQATLSLSHYIKNILMGIKGGSSLMEMGIKKEDPKLVATSWPIIERSLLKISNLARDMLAYSKEREPDYARTDAGELLEDIARCARESAKGAGVELEVEIGEGLDAVEIDETSIHDSALNLTVNAIDACQGPGAPPEGGRVRLAARPLDGGTFAIEVSDNGPGIPDHIQKKIFEAFFSTKGGKGTGLGLAVARKAAQEHGGRLELESEPGHGATFRLVLPLRRAPSA